jgi:STAS-like domain of unknown function (DUF4325)
MTKHALLDIISGKLRMQEININVAEYLEDRSTIDHVYSECLFLTIKKQLKKNGNVILDFKDIELITLYFLQVVIGQLYRHFDSLFLQEHLKIDNILPEDIYVLKKVIENAKEKVQYNT